MAKQISKRDIVFVRRFIIEAKRENPYLTEKAIYEKILEARPDLVPGETVDGKLPLERFRHHYGKVREVARASGVRIEELPTTDFALPAKPAPEDLTPAIRYQEARRRLLQLEAREREIQEQWRDLEEERERIERQMRESVEALTQEMAELTAKKELGSVRS